MTGSGSDCVGTTEFLNPDGLDFVSYETYGESPSPDPGPSSYVVTERTGTSKCPATTNERNPQGG